MTKTLQFVTVVLLLLFSTTYLKAQDANNDGYHDGDVAVMKDAAHSTYKSTIVHGSTINWESAECSKWNRVVWTDTQPKRIKKLDIARLGIVNFDISSLAELEYLNCESNKLSILNVSGLTKLKTLMCGNNDIHTIHVEGCTVLEVLFCQGNKITILDLSSIKSLINFNGFRNRITSIDVSGSPLLESFNIEENNVNSLNISGCLALKDLKCSKNNLVLLDLSEFTKLTELRCTHNKLVDLKLENCTELTYVSCSGNNLFKLNLSGFTNLKELYCGSNKLNSLDITGCNSLEKINCHINRLKVLDASDCSSLITVNCYKNHLGQIEINSDKLQTFKCYENRLPFSQLNKVIGCQYFTGHDQNNVFEERSIGLDDFIDYNEERVFTKGRTTFSWYKNGSKFLENTEAIYIPKTKGLYSCKMTNHSFEGITIVTSETLVTDENTIPTDISLSNKAINENNTGTNVVGKFSTTDSDTDDRFKYTISENPYFAIQDDILITKLRLNFEELQPFYKIVVTSTDLRGNSFSKDFYITIVDEKEFQGFFFSTDKIQENLPINTIIGTLSGEEYDHESGEVSFELVTGKEYFKIEGAKLISIKPIDYETIEPDNEIMKRVRFSVLLKIDGETRKSKTFYLEVIDTNDAPRSFHLVDKYVYEELNIGDVAAIVRVIDPDINSIFSFTIEENEYLEVAATKQSRTKSGGSHTYIHGAGCEIITKKAFDYETIKTFDFSMTVTDIGGISYTQSLSVVIQNVNEAPSDIILSSDNFDENSPIGTVIGTVTAIDPDTGASVSVDEIANDFLDVKFGKLITKKIVDYEQLDHCPVTIVAVDNKGVTLEKTFNIKVNNLNEGTTDISLSNTVIDKNSTIGSFIGDITNNDPDVDDIIVYTISDNDYFKVAGNKLLTKSSLESVIEKEHIISLTATDLKGLSFQKDFNIVISSAPHNFRLSVDAIAETTTIGTEVSIISADPGSLNDVLTFEIDKNDWFKIEGNKLISKSILDFETHPNVQIVAYVSNQYGLRIQSEFTINILDVNEAPAALELSNNKIEENLPVGTVVGTVSAVDADKDDVLIYTIVENENFKIERNELITKSTFDFEAENIYAVNITVSDAAGLSFNKVFNVTIKDVNEAPTVISLSSSTVQENTETGFEIGTLSSNEKDANDAVSFTIAANENFELDGDKLITTSVFNYEEKNSYTISITATDQSGLAVSKEFEIAITDKNETPVFISEPNTSIQLTSEYIYDIECFDIDGDDLTVEAIELPNWLNLSSNNDGSYKLKGTPTHMGDYNVVLSLTDGEFTIKQEFEIVTDYILSVEEVATKQSVNIYPNPVVNELHIDLSDINSDKIIISLFTLTGNQVFKEIYQNNMGRLKIQKSVQNLKDGMYLLLIESDQNKKGYKIIKR